MSSQTVSAAPRRRFWRPRFSLRALLIGMTLLCLVFAPVLPELNRARNVAQQVKIIEEMGGECVFVDRPRSFWASLVQRLWPVQIAHLEHDLLMAEFNEQTVDLAKLRGTPDVRGICFNECQFVLPENEPDVLLPRIEYVQWQERDDVKGGKPDPAILRRFPAFFPNLRKAQLLGVPQVQEFIDALAACKRLEDLDVWFTLPVDDVDTAPLGLLSELRRLRVSGVSLRWNWAFLVRLDRLEVAEFGSPQEPVGGDHYASVSLGGKIFGPSYALTQLKWLRSVMLYEEGAWDKQLPAIAENNELEYVRIAGRWSTDSALEALRGETSLRSLGGLTVHGDGEKVFERLGRLPELRELEIHFTSLSDDDLRRLNELNSLERIVLSFDPHSGAVSSEGIELFRKLPIAELRCQYSSGQPLADGMQRLIDSWPGPHPGRPFRQTDEGKQFLLDEAQEK